ncbi:MAG: hypothetical protein ACMUIM_05775 [bacterium]
MKEIDSHFERLNEILMDRLRSDSLGNDPEIQNEKMTISALTGDAKYSFILHKRRRAITAFSGYG